MIDPSSANPNRQIVRKTTLDQEGASGDYSGFTPEQRLMMVWPITLNAGNSRNRMEFNRDFSDMLVALNDADVPKTWPICMA